MSRRTYLQVQPDSHPDLPIERGARDTGVGDWVPLVKHRLLADFVEATWAARSKFPERVFIDPFCGPGRIQVEGEQGTRDGGSLAAWRQSQAHQAGAFTSVLVGDLDPARTSACEQRLLSAGAPVKGVAGPAAATVREMLKLVTSPQQALCLAYIDPYNLQHLSFNIIEQLSRLPRVDFIVHFSTMDLTRNVEFEFDPQRARFDETAPGWRDRIDPRTLGKRSLREAFFQDWCHQIKGLGFSFSKRMPLVSDENRALYRLVLFSRSALPKRIWDDVARGPNRELFE